MIEEATADPRRDEHEQHERPQDPGRNTLGEEHLPAPRRSRRRRASTGHGASRRRHAHGVESGGVEHGNEGRIRRAGERPEQLLVDARRRSRSPSLSAPRTPTRPTSTDPESRAPRNMASSMTPAAAMPTAVTTSAAPCERGAPRTRPRTARRAAARHAHAIATPGTASTGPSENGTPTMRSMVHVEPTTATPRGRPVRRDVRPHSMSAKPRTHQRNATPLAR